jgi:hypothetical protein
MERRKKQEENPPEKKGVLYKLSTKMTGAKWKEKQVEVKNQKCKVASVKKADYVEVQ